VPRGCAVIWVHPDYQHHIFPVVTSLYELTDFDLNFSYQGTDDNSQYYTAQAALKFYQDIGGHVRHWFTVLSVHYSLRLSHSHESEGSCSHPVGGDIHPLNTVVSPLTKHSELPPPSGVVYGVPR